MVNNEFFITMRYIPPVDASDDNAPYITGNPATNTRGSRVPGQAIEYPMREIVNTIVTEKIITDNNNLMQFNEAIDKKIKKNVDQFDLLIEQVKTQAPDTQVPEKDKQDIAQNLLNLQDQLDQLKQNIDAKLQQAKKSLMDQITWHDIQHKSTQFISNIRFGARIQEHPWNVRVPRWERYADSQRYPYYRNEDVVSLHSRKGYLVTFCFKPHNYYFYTHCFTRPLQKQINNVWYTVDFL